MADQSMTLEQVRSILNEWPRRTADNLDPLLALEMRDAIDAHLAKQRKAEAEADKT